MTAMIRFLTRRKNITEEDLNERYAEDPDLVLRVKKWILTSHAYRRDIVHRLAELLNVNEDHVIDVLLRARSCSGLYGLHSEVEQVERLLDNVDDEVVALAVLMDVVSDGKLGEALENELLRMFEGRKSVPIDRKVLTKFFTSLRERGII